MTLRVPITLDVFIYSDQELESDNIGIEVPFDHDDGEIRKMTFWEINGIWEFRDDERCSCVASNGSEFVIKMTEENLFKVIEKAR